MNPPFFVKARKIKGLPHCSEYSKNWAGHQDRQRTQDVKAPYHLNENDDPGFDAGMIDELLPFHAQELSYRQFHDGFIPEQGSVGRIPVQMLPGPAQEYADHGCLEQPEGPFSGVSIHWVKVILRCIRFCP